MFQAVETANDRGHWKTRHCQAAVGYICINGACPKPPWEGEKSLIWSRTSFAPRSVSHVLTVACVNGKVFVQILPMFVWALNKCWHTQLPACLPARQICSMGRWNTPDFSPGWWPICQEVNIALLKTREVFDESCQITLCGYQCHNGPVIDTEWWIMDERRGLCLSEILTIGPLWSHS